MTTKSSEIIMEIGKWTGLGNQMFQYAAAFSLVLHTGHKLRIKREFRYLLDIFPWVAKNQSLITDIPPNLSMWKEKSQAYDPSFWNLDPEKNWYIEGYMQNIKYFQQFSEEIRQIFSFKYEVREYCNNILRPYRQLGKKIIGIHLRVPDFRSESPDDFLYTFPTPEYITKNMEWYLANYKDCVFFLFSNDIERCRLIYDLSNVTSQENIKWMDQTRGQQHSIETDLCMLSLCDHYILSPSTFGWWAVFLNPSKEKSVIMCKPWFNKRRFNFLNDELSELYLPEWLTVDIEANKGKI